MIIKYLSILAPKISPKRFMSHIPVMTDNVVNYLKDASIIVDMTFGEGGHTKALLQSSKSTVIICLDRDPNAFKTAQKLANDYPNRVYPVHGKFSDLPLLLEKLNIKELDGFLFDFGCSSDQMDIAERGFSLSKTGPLDMRMDPESDKITASHVLQYAEEYDLYKILKIYGEEKYARKIARAIVERRYTFLPLRTTTDLANLVASVAAAKNRTDKLGRPSHPATKVFQALRIFVNNEMNEIDYGMILARHFLKIGGKLITISFHSLEDTIVKRHLTGNLLQNSANPVPLRYASYYPCSDEEIKNEPDWMMLTKHVVTPSNEEIENNPRSRSAKLRAAVKIK